MATSTFQVPGAGSLAYEASGPEGGRLVVLAQGMGDTRRAYRFVAPKLAAEGYRVVAVDIRGTGESSVEWDEFSRTAIGKDLVALAKHLGATSAQPAVIVGHSISGGAATVAAAEGPDVICGIVELAPFTRAQSMGVGDLFRKGIPSLIGTIVIGSTCTWSSYLNAATPVRKPADWDVELKKIVANLNEPGRMKVLQKMASSPPTDAGARLKDVKCRVLIVEGSKDPDFASPKAEGEGIVKELPEGLGELEVLEGAGHYPHVDSADQTVAVILPFLAKVFGAKQA